jgi:hypothetical protein
MGNAKSDFKATIDRIAEASRWKKGTIEDWLSRGEVVCANLMEEVEEVLKKAEARVGGRGEDPDHGGPV